MNYGLDLKTALNIVRSQRKRKNDTNACGVVGSQNSRSALDEKGFFVAQTRLGGQCPMDETRKLYCQATGTEESTVASVITSNETNVLINSKVEIGNISNFIKLVSKRRYWKKFKMQLEKDTGTTLSIPSKKEAKCGAPIVVEGSSNDAITLAAGKLQDILEQDHSKEHGEAKFDLYEELPLGVLDNVPTGDHAIANTCIETGRKSISSDLMATDTKVEAKHSTYVEADKRVLRLLKRSNLVKNIERETDASICIASPIVVQATTEGSLEKALKALYKVIDEAVNGPRFQYTHFISLPLSVHPMLVEQLTAFQESVMALLDISNDKSVSSFLDGEVNGNMESGCMQLEVTSDIQNAQGVENKKMEINDCLDDRDKHLAVEHKTSVECSISPLQVEEQQVDEDTSMDHDKRQESRDNALIACSMGHEGVDILKSSFMNNFQDESEVTKRTLNKKGFGIEKSIFIKPSTFHLTVLMLKLWNEERVNAAGKVLEQTLPRVFDVLEGRPVMITLKGLECMKGPPSKARVLYARVEDQGDRLLQACYVIINAFVEAGLVLVKDRKHCKQLKLHATIMNSSHRSKKSKFKNKSFDATELVEKYGLQNWGEYQILEAHLSQRFKYDTNGYYQCCSSIPFPKSEK